jgi:hypothetical protein
MEIDPMFYVPNLRAVAGFALLLLAPGFAAAQCVWNPDRHIHQCPSVPAYVPTIYDWGGGIGNGGENPGAQYGVGYGAGSAFCREHLASRPPNCGWRPNPAQLDDPFFGVHSSNSGLGFVRSAAELMVNCPFCRDQMIAHARNHLSATSSGYLSPDWNNRQLVGAVISTCQYYFDFYVPGYAMQIDPTLVPAFAPCSTAIGRLISESGQHDIGSIDREAWMRQLITTRFGNHPNLADSLNTLVALLVTAWISSTDAFGDSIQSRGQALREFKSCSEWYAVNDNTQCGGL